MTTQKKRWLKWMAAALVFCVVALLIWQRYSGGEEDGIASGNGRIEATEINVAAKIAGRIKEILVREGDFVTAGQVVAQMDTEVLEAQLREAEAQLQRARSTAATARSQLVQRQAEKEVALAVVRQREAELNLARRNLARSLPLAAGGAVSQQEVDTDRAAVQNSVAAVAAAEAAIVTARAELAGAESAIEAAQASIQRIQADIDDSALKSPRDGRVQYRVAQPGEVVAAGAPVLNLVDLSDVYMTFFLPTVQAGRVALGAEVRLVLDAAPQYVIPARVSFVANVAQFTPKTVETKIEREKLMFRIRAHISPELLRKHITQVKTGLPGVAYVRLDPAVEWPDRLAVRVAR